MSTVKNPVGPEQPSTYWRRRAVVLLVLVVILLLGWLSLRALLSSDDDSQGQPPSASASASVTAPASSAASASQGSASRSAAPEPSASGSPSPSPSPSAICADSDIEVGASTAAASAGVGAGMGVTMTVTNTGEAACNRDVGAGANEVRITSGSVLVWSSDFCSPSKKSEVVALKPGKSFTTSVTWPGDVTTKDCPADQPTAQSGTYMVQARNADVASDRVTFTVQ